MQTCSTRPSCYEEDQLSKLRGPKCKERTSLTWHHVLSPDWMITVKPLSSVSTSTEVLHADIHPVSVSLAALISHKIVREGEVGVAHLMWSSRLPAMWCYSGRWSGDPAPSGLWKMASGAAELVIVCWISHGFAFLYTFSPQQTSLTPKCAYTPTCIHFPCLIKPIMPQSMSLP